MAKAKPKPKPKAVAAKKKASIARRSKGEYDPSRVFENAKSGRRFDLSTGLEITMHDFGSPKFGSTNIVSDERLARMRAKAGWDANADYEAAKKRMTMSNGYVPVAVQSKEAYDRYLAGARSNYQSMDSKSPASKTAAASTATTPKATTAATDKTSKPTTYGARRRTRRNARARRKK